jgi:hypothetical protein
MVKPTGKRLIKVDESAVGKALGQRAGLVLRS